MISSSGVTGSSASGGTGKRDVPAARSSARPARTSSRDATVWNTRATDDARGAAAMVISWARMWSGWP